MQKVAFVQANAFLFASLLEDTPRNGETLMGCIQYWQWKA